MSSIDVTATFIKLERRFKNKDDKLIKNKMSTLMHVLRSKRTTLQAQAQAQAHLTRDWSSSNTP